MTIAIIGGGASGLMAAISAKLYNEDARVIIVEEREKLGKKILSSGNGRCNFSNVNASPEHYNHPHFVKDTFNKFSVKDTLKFFESLGLMYVNDDEGRLYPISYNASTIQELLIDECVRLGVEIMLNKRALTINKIHDKFNIKLSESDILADKVILTVGGKVGINREVNNNSILSSLKLNQVKQSPALVPLKTSKSQVKGLSGVRVKANATLFKDNKPIFSEYGEVLFKDEGISGIVIFNLSLIVARNGQGKYTVSLDLLPNMSKDDIINRFNKLALDIPKFLKGIFNSKVKDRIIKDCKDLNIDNVANIIKDMRFDIIAPYSFANAQISVGGISIEDINPATLEYKTIPNLYFAGEVIDIDGLCGGYNLQWAWSSGAVAGKSASQ